MRLCIYLLCRFILVASAADAKLYAWLWTLFQLWPTALRDASVLDAASQPRGRFRCQRKPRLPAGQKRAVLFFFLDQREKERACLIVKDDEFSFFYHKETQVLHDAYTGEIPFRAYLRGLCMSQAQERAPN